MNALLIAIQFLTRLPTPGRLAFDGEQLGRSLLWYPTVGLLLGILLWLLQMLLGATPLLLQAALLLAVWVALTGALHLDGFADSVDAWVGGQGDSARTLEIMKDPRSGPMAVTALVLLLLLKFVAVYCLLQQEQVATLLLAPWLARGLLPVLLLSTPYVRPGGLGSALVEHLPRDLLPRVLLVNALVMLLFGWVAVYGLLIAGLGFCLLRHLMMARLQGTTGDSAGAMVELIEVALLVGWVVLL